MNLFHTRAARLVLVLPVIFLSVQEFFAPVLTLAYRLHDTGAAKMMGGFTPGGDYRRFIPVMDATPLALQVLWAAAGVLFLVSAWLLLRNNRATFQFFLCALALSLIGSLFAHTLPAYREAFSFSPPNFRRDVLMPAAQMVLPFLVAAVLWRMTRRVPPLPSS